jgi:hypothetical protein
VNSIVVSFLDETFIRKRRHAMKQRWLIKPFSADESSPTFIVDLQTRLELVSLMAQMIESLHRRRLDAQQTKESAHHERLVSTSQD